MEEKIVKVLNEMSEYLSIAQMKKLQEVIVKTFAENEVTKTNISNDEFLKMAEDFATKNSIYHGVYEDKRRYVVEFYLRDNATEDMDGWVELQRESDFCTFTVMSINPSKIKLTLCRVKR